MSHSQVYPSPETVIVPISHILRVTRTRLSAFDAFCHPDKGTTMIFAQLRGLKIYFQIFISYGN